MGLRPTNSRKALTGMSFYDALDAAAAKTTCDLLANAGGSLIGYGAITALAGGGGLVPMGAGAIALMTKNLLCDPGWDPDQRQPSDVPSLDCAKAADGSPFDVYFVVPSISYREKILQNVVEVTSIEPTPDQPEGSTQQNVNAIKAGGGSDFGQFFPEPGGFLETTIAAGNCGSDPLDPDWVPPPPTTYTDPVTNCNYIVSFQDFLSLPGGSLQPVYKISPGGQGLRTGGIIGGCNFSPVVYVGGPPGQPPYVGPWDPTWPDGPGGGGGTPPWLDLVNDLIGGIVSNIISNELAKLFEVPYDAGSRTIYAACEYKQDGTPETFTVNYPQQPYQARVLTALDAITDFQQQILLWKTPTCGGGGQPLTGEPVTINWISDEFSGTSGDRVQKLFTYFDQSGKTQAEHQAHWKDFSWQAGPVIVSCVGTPLGKPQVWAVSLEEAKRVIGHAAAISGVDLAKAEWLTGSPRSSSFGLRGTMRVKVSDKGLLWVTKRDGPFGLPTAPG